MSLFPVVFRFPITRMPILFRSVAAFAIGMLLLATVNCVSADERLFGIACRSVHLGYPAPPADVFYNEISVTNSADGSYFMVAGWSKGYFGIQELGDGSKVALFSVWDPGNQNDPGIVPESRKVKVLKQADDVTVKRFGGEGTGGQCFFKFDWKAGETYRFAVASQPDGDRTAFSGFIYLNESQQWKHLVTFSTISNNSKLTGLYSFVEDFRRNRVSTTKNRQAEFGVGWVRTQDNGWSPLRSARFTGDANPATNIDGGILGKHFFLSTGGDVTSEHGKLRETYTLPDEVESPKPHDILTALDAAVSDVIQGNEASK
ncbi:MAG: DUF3472 domain-containing protein [Planctomycetaceae bacterium]|nr:DUF3472 domain-containing protein [Planctomycetaceae bacterium]